MPARPGCGPWPSDEDGAPVGACYREFPQYFPRPGWVEHDPEEIWAAVAATLAALLDGSTSRSPPSGITNQRETVVVWDRRTGRPRHRAIVWQDRRAAPRCEALEAAGYLDLIRARTGLVLDPYFSATKLGLASDEGGVEAGPDLAFGTVDSWLLWRLTGGAVHATDPTNASRTLLFDIDRMAWDAGAGRAVRRPAVDAARGRCRRAAGWGRPPAGWCRACRPGCRSAGSPATSRPPCSARPASSRA